MNVNLQQVVSVVSICAGLATVGTFIYATCDRISRGNTSPPTEITVNPCPPILPPGKVCNYPYSQKIYGEKVN